MADEQVVEDEKSEVTWEDMMDEVQSLKGVVSEATQQVSLLAQRIAKLDLESLYRNADVVRMVQECTVELKTMRNEMATDGDGEWRRRRNYGRRLRGSVDSLKRLSTILPCPSKRICQQSHISLCLALCSFLTGRSGRVQCAAASCAD